MSGISQATIDAMERLHQHLRKQESEALLAMYGPDPVHVSVSDEGEIRYRRIPLGEFYEAPNPRSPGP